MKKSIYKSYDELLLILNMKRRPRRNSAEGFRWG